jgi:hypothetical protein
VPDAVRKEPDYAPSAGDRRQVGAGASKRKALKSEDHVHHLEHAVVGDAVPPPVAAFVGEALEIFTPHDGLFA